MSTNIKLINQRISLERVVFEKKSFVQSSLKVVINDNIQNINVADQNISFEYHRLATLEPSSLFVVEVIFSYSSKIDDESFKNMKESNKKLSNNDFIGIINNTNLPQTASMIIANLTIVNGGNPLITPPMFVK